jgi:hypothetical protein
MLEGNYGACSGAVTTKWNNFKTNVAWQEVGMSISYEEFNQLYWTQVKTSHDVNHKVALSEDSDGMASMESYDQLYKW